MKLIFSLLILSAVVATILCLKDPICGQEFAKNTDEFGYSCRAEMWYYSYDSSKNGCIEFSYGGCYGNDNRFDSKDECEKKCVE